MISGIDGGKKSTEREQIKEEMKMQKRQEGERERERREQGREKRQVGVRRCAGPGSWQVAPWPGCPPACVRMSLGPYSGSAGAVTGLHVSIYCMCGAVSCIMLWHA